MNSIKDLPIRERQYWLAVHHHRIEMEQWQKLTSQGVSQT